MVWWWRAAVRRWELRAQLSASQGPPPPVGLIRGREREQRATLEMPSARRALQPVKPREWRVDPRARAQR